MSADNIFRDGAKVVVVVLRCDKGSLVVVVVVVVLWLTDDRIGDRQPSRLRDELCFCSNLYSNAQTNLQRVFQKARPFYLK